VDYSGPSAAIAPQALSKQPPVARRFRTGLVVATVAGVSVLAGGFYWFRNEKETQAHASNSGQHAGIDGGGESGSASKAEGLPVDVAHPKQGGMERTTTQAATVHAFEYASLYSKVSGYLKVQNVDIGDKVERGQLLAVIEDPEVDKAVEQNEAALIHANAEVDVAVEMVASAEAIKVAFEAKVHQEETEVAAKLSNQELQGKQLRRIEGLVQRNAVDAKLQDEQKDRYDVSTADLGVVRATVLTAKADVLAKAALVGKAKADLAEAKADVEISKANLAKARVMQGYTRITSPYDGVVTLRSFHRGDFIRSASEGGAIPLLAVARTDKVRVVVPIPDVDVPFLNRGDAATFQVVALPGQTFHGVVSRYSETEDAESRNMRTEVDLPNLDDKLREGMYGRMTVTLQQAVAGSLTIPSTSLISQSGKGVGTLYVVRDGKARKVDVQVTKDNGVEAEILGGVAPKDEVITHYIGSINDGTAVVADPTRANATTH